MNGRGFVRIAALDTARYSDDQTHASLLGHRPAPRGVVAQNKHGHVLGDVTDQGKTIDDPTSARQRMGGVALDYHTDGSDLVGLLCLRTARSVVSPAWPTRGDPRPPGAGTVGPRGSVVRAAARRHGAQASGARAFFRSRRSPSTPDGSSSGSFPSTSSPGNAIPDAPRSCDARRPFATSALAKDSDFNVYMDLQPRDPAHQQLPRAPPAHRRRGRHRRGYKGPQAPVAGHPCADRTAAYFAALGRRSHWEQRRSVSTLHRSHGPTAGHRRGVVPRPISSSGRRACAAHSPSSSPE